MKAINANAHENWLILRVNRCNLLKTFGIDVEDKAVTFNYDPIKCVIIAKRLGFKPMYLQKVYKRERLTDQEMYSFIKKGIAPVNYLDNNIPTSHDLTVHLLPYILQTERIKHYINQLVKVKPRLAVIQFDAITAVMMMHMALQSIEPKRQLLTLNNLFEFKDQQLDDIDREIRLWALEVRSMISEELIDTNR